METEQMKNNISGKEHKWLYFAGGVLAGFVLSLTIFFIDRVYFNNKLRWAKIIEETVQKMEPRAQPVALTLPAPLPQRIDTIYIPVHGWIKETPRKDTVFIISEQEDDNAVSFAMDKSSTEPETDVIPQDMIIESRTVKVTNKTNNSTPPPIPKMIVQQWSSPIKNNIVYQRDSNILKIKGIDISVIEILFFNNEYHLVKGDYMYSIPKNSRFEKLQ
ncbi:MAG: hypothetical protein LBR51_05925 [Bacteroidales bacterium]|jgi:hypothetical protein|nr:hypothetical protein [Bacteroidales bacterium]